MLWVGIHAVGPRRRRGFAAAFFFLQKGKSGEGDTSVVVMTTGPSSPLAVSVGLDSQDLNAARPVPKAGVQAVTTGHPSAPMHSGTAGASASASAGDVADASAGRAMCSVVHVV